jgi:hypothetical protein
MTCIDRQAAPIPNWDAPNVKSNLRRMTVVWNGDQADIQLPTRSGCLQATGGVPSCLHRSLVTTSFGALSILLGREKLHIDFRSIYPPQFAPAIGQTRR